MFLPSHGGTDRKKLVSCGILTTYLFLILNTKRCVSDILMRNLKRCDRLGFILLRAFNYINHAQNDQ
jgi:hypothetical protein